MLPLLLSAQSDSTFDLPEFILEQDQALRTTQDLQGQGADLSVLFRQSVLSDIRSAGPGILSPISFRGGSSAQTTVQWNGIPLESPTNSICDLALIPGFFFDEVSTGGGNSSISGPGTISGSVLLKSRFANSDRLILGAGLGSFGLQTLQADLNRRIGKMENRTRVFGLREENNFSYVDFGSERVDQTHSAREAYGLMQQNAWRYKQIQFKSQIWYQSFYREIPPTMLEARSAKYQEDRNLRSSLTMNWFKGRNSWRGNIGYAREYLRYSDSLAGLDEKYKANFLVVQGHYRRQLTRQIALFAFLEDRFASAQAHNYYDNNRNEFSPAAHLKWSGETGSAMFSLRRSFYLDQSSPMLFALEFGQRFGSHHTVVNVSKNYRLPTMNDLFWLPGGNPELQPELSHRAELIWQFHWKRQDLQLTVFDHRIQDQILWLPNSTGIYTASQSNVPTWNRGAELNFTRTDSLGKWRIQSRAQMQYLRSTKEETLSDWFGGEQQIFVPESQGSLAIDVSKSQRSAVSVSLKRMSGRYTLDDHSRSLPAFTLMQASFQHQLSGSWQVSLQLSNLLNTSYTILEYRPMPGFGWNALVHYTISQHKHKNK
ncbi:MAG: TonB-dependent receptor [Flavobacteriales bacterium]|nr:TonB-dependent receptor [Flavobacteriales bacterium]